MKKTNNNICEICKNETSNEEILCSRCLKVIKYISSANYVERKRFTRPQLIRIWDNLDSKIKNYEEERIREENAAALTFSVLWVSLVSIIFVLVAQLIVREYIWIYKLFLNYIQILFLSSIVILLIATILFWHGSSTDHDFNEYVLLNENGDSYTMFGSLIVILGLSLVSSYQIMKLQMFNFDICGFNFRFFELILPMIIVTIVIMTFDRLSVRISGKKIFWTYLIEATRIIYFFNSDNDNQKLIQLLENERKWKGYYSWKISLLGLLLFLVILGVILPMYIVFYLI